MLKVYNTASTVYLETFHTETDINGSPRLCFQWIHLKQSKIKEEVTQTGGVARGEIRGGRTTLKTKSWFESQGTLLLGDSGGIQRSYKIIQDV